MSEKIIKQPVCSECTIRFERIRCLHVRQTHGSCIAGKGFAGVPEGIGGVAQAAVAATGLGRNGPLSFEEHGIQQFGGRKILPEVRNTLAQPVADLQDVVIRNKAGGQGGAKEIFRA